MEQMSERDDLLADLRVQRVVKLLGQYGLRADGSARLLRRLAEWYQPTGMRACDTCSEPFKAQRRTARYCSSACRKVANRRKRTQNGVL